MLPSGGSARTRSSCSSRRLLCSAPTTLNARAMRSLPKLCEPQLSRQSARARVTGGKLHAPTPLQARSCEPRRVWETALGQGAGRNSARRRTYLMDGTSLGPAGLNCA